MVTTVNMFGPRQNSHHVVQRCDVQCQIVSGPLQFVHYRGGGRKKLKLYLPILCPALQEGKHTQRPPSDRFDLVEIKSNDSRVPLRHHGVSQFEHGFTSHDPSFAIDQG